MEASVEIINLYMVVIRLSLFPGFSTTREMENFQKISWKSREIFGIPKIYGFGKFLGNFPERDHFDIFYDFQRFRSNFQQFVMLF